ncbi:hypothetical protein [Brotaphodocola sp.]|uniref:hypothetical protein n=1 Tax=Brotaphodocola sp. TaxID=3073577 RepID=UPI003D7DA1EE
MKWTDKMLLMVTALVLFSFGYYISKRFDDFMEQSNKQFPPEHSTVVSIASEPPVLLNLSIKTLDSCFHINPCMEFHFSVRSFRQLLQKISDGTVDLAFISDQSIQEVPDNHNLGRIHIKNPDKNCYFWILWNRQVSSQDRDRILLTFENTFPVEKTTFL